MKVTQNKFNCACAEQIKASHIINSVELITGRKKITSKRTRRQADLFARYHAIHFLRKFTTLSLQRIGEIACPKRPFNHATVIHAIKTAQDLIDTMEGRSNFYKHHMMLHHFFIGSETLN